MSRAYSTRVTYINVSGQLGTRMICSWLHKHSVQRLSCLKREDNFFLFSFWMTKFIIIFQDEILTVSLLNYGAILQSVSFAYKFCSSVTVLIKGSTI